jgi:hypothetical protein
MLDRVIEVLADVPNVHVNPKAKGLPGGSVLQNLLDGLAFWALLACLAGMIIGAGVWTWAAHSNNHHYSASGRRGVLVSAAAALVIGASAALVNFFAEQGGKVR